MTYKYLNPRKYVAAIAHRLNRGAKQSFSQSGEDLIIDFIFGALRIARPSYIDIGACDPFDGSNTALFYKKGSWGITIEANPLQHRRFRSRRRRTINLNIGIAPSDGQLDFYALTEPGLSTFSRDEATRLIESYGHKLLEGYPRSIPVSTIASVLDQYAAGQMPDFMTIDTEGLDEPILRALDWKRHRPKVICVETVDFSPRIGEGAKNSNLIAFIEGCGYLAYADTRINTIFVDRRLLSS